MDPLQTIITGGLSEISGLSATLSTLIAVQGSQLPAVTPSRFQIVGGTVEQKQAVEAAIARLSTDPVGAKVLSAFSQGGVAVTIRFDPLDPGIPGDSNWRNLTGTTRVCGHSAAERGFP